MCFWHTRTDSNQTVNMVRTRRRFLRNARPRPFVQDLVDPPRQVGSRLCEAIDDASAAANPAHLEEVVPVHHLGAIHEEP